MPQLLSFEILNFAEKVCLLGSSATVRADIISVVGGGGADKAFGSNRISSY